MNEAASIVSLGNWECYSLSVLALARLEFDSLEKWLHLEEASLMGLQGVELGEELRGRELLRLLLQAHIECRGDGDVGLSIEVRDEKAGKILLYTHKRIRRRRIVSIFGEVCVRRMIYSMEGKASIHPLDEQLELPARSFSYELQRRLVKKSVQSPFDEAIDGVQEWTGVRVPKRMAEEILIDASLDFDSFYAGRRGNGADDSGPILVGSVDCKGIPMIKRELALKKIRRRKGEKAQKKRMATVAAVFTQRPYVRTPEEVVDSLFDREKERDKRRDNSSRPERKRVWASLKAGKESFIKDVNEEMNRRDPRHMKLWVVVTDGERALQQRVRRIIKGVILVLDFFHVLERLWETGHALYGEKGNKAEVFVRHRALRILRGEISQVIKGIRQIVTKRNLRGQKRKKLLDATKYFYKNRSRMRYDAYLKRGLPIGSGSVEGACKNLIGDRMERSGMRWTERMAEAMLKNRATYVSGDLDDYWQYHISQDQKRLYPEGHWKPLASVVAK